MRTRQANSRSAALKPARHAAIWLASVGLFAGAFLAGSPVATQRPGEVLGPVATVNGRPAIAGEVLVKFRRQPTSSERAELGQLIDADQDRAIGSTGVRRMHSAP
jgi:hypothetical protein